MALRGIMLGIDEMLEIGADLLPDPPPLAEDNKHGLYLVDTDLPSFPSNSEELFEDEVVGGDAS